MNTAATSKNDIQPITNAAENPFKDIYEQYVDEASFLWLLRSIAVNQPHYTQTEIHELEQRIDAQLDGLMTSIEEVWSICLEALELEQPGEVFTSAIIAFKSHDATKIQKVIEVGLSNDESMKGLISAIGWLPEKFIHAWIKKFLTSKDLNHKYLAISACSVRRENPGEFLNRILSREDCKQHSKLYARALRLIGELRRQDLMPALEEALQSENKDVLFWANWSAILLGNHTAANNLQTYIFNANPYQEKAINIVFRVLPIDQARVWISQLSSNTDLTRMIIKTTGVLGDPHAINWLILKMKESAISRLAAESFTLITGFDLEENLLIGEIPAHLDIQPNNDINDEDVSLDEDENLAWPDYDKVSTFWMNNGSRFISGQRYLLGIDIQPASLKDILTNAFQRQRHAAALELALIDSSSPLQNTKARVVVK